MIPVRNDKVRLAKTSIRLGQTGCAGHSSGNATKSTKVATALRNNGQKQDIQADISVQT
jgi:hypothetical protein